MRAYEAGARHAHKLVCFDDDTARLERARALLDGMGDALEVNSSWWNNIEVMHRGVDKAGQWPSCARYTAWSAMRLWRSAITTMTARCCARRVGRSRWANGSDGLKRIARIIAPDCNDSGVGASSRNTCSAGRSSEAVMALTRGRAAVCAEGAMERSCRLCIDEVLENRR